VLFFRNVWQRHGVRNALVATSMILVSTLVPLSQANGAAPSSRLGDYYGTTSPAWGAVEGSTPVRLPRKMGLSIVMATFGSCGGPLKSTTSVVCLTSGSVTASGAVANEGDAAGWDTVPLGLCSYAQADWTPAYRVPTSGHIVMHQVISRWGDATANIQVSNNGNITGSILLRDYISSNATGGKSKPLCSSGLVTFHLHRVA
jgi:hypothetical protein